MIRREDTDGWFLINQNDHAALSGEIMTFWGNSTFSIPDPREEVLFAIRNHDNGWLEWDSTPKIYPVSSYPMNFMEMDFQDQEEIWRRCFRRYSLEHPYASALIALHFSRFNQKIIDKNHGNRGAQRLKTEMNEYIQNSLKINLSNETNNQLPNRDKVNLRLVQVGDIISLALCHGWEEIEIDDVPLSYNGKSLKLRLESRDGRCFRLTPYPFSKPLLHLEVRGRKLSQKTFRCDEELRQMLIEYTYDKLELSIQH